MNEPEQDTQPDPYLAGFAGPQPIDDQADAPEAQEVVVAEELRPAEPLAVRAPHYRTAGVLTALVVVLGLAAATFAYTSLRSTEGRLRAVAHRVATNLVNFDYRTIDADLERIRADATGAFLQQFTEALGEDQPVFRQAIVEARGSSTGRIHWVALAVLDADRALAVVEVTQSVTNADTPDPESESRRMEMSLVRTPSGWKVDDIRLRSP